MICYAMRKLSENEVIKISGGDKQGNTRVIECYYWRETKKLAEHGSHKTCPSSYDSAISENPNMKAIDQIQDRVFYGVTLKVPAI